MMNDAQMPDAQPEGQGLDRYDAILETVDRAPTDPCIGSLKSDVDPAPMTADQWRNSPARLAAHGVTAEPPAATPTAQEAVAWLIEGYGVTDNKAFAKVYGEQQNKVVTLLYAHPPQPSVSVAEAQIDAIAVALSKRIYKQTEGEWQPSIRQADELARAALRALKGGEANG